MKADELTDRAADSPVQNPEPASTLTTTLLFDQEDGVTLSPPKRQPITITPSLAKVFVRASSTTGTAEPPLTFSTLLVAMLADEDTWLKRHFESQQVRFDAIAEHRRYREASLQSLNDSGLEDEYLTTISARAAIEEATRIAQHTSGGSTVDARHLCAAYPILSKWHVEDFATFGIDRLEWARAFGAEMAQRFPKERAYWGSYADRASPVPLTSFSADVYTEEDLLGIDRSVDALALLVASTRTVTPLAIGVFGPWGSGKTFFMRHLQKRIVGIRRSERPRIEAWIAKRKNHTARLEDAPLYFAEIAQVEFNAWHYNEGNLVASLVEHLFRNLRVQPDDNDEQLAKRRADMLRQLKVLTSDLSTVDETIAAAEKNVAEAKAGVEQASKAAEAAKDDVGTKARELETRNAALVQERKKLADAIKDIERTPDAIDPDAVIAVALGPLAPLIADVRATLAGARETVFDWRDFAARVFSAKGLAVVVLCLVAPFALWLMNALQGQWAAFLGSVAAALTGFGSAIDVIKRHRAQFEAKLDELDTEQRRRVGEAKAAIVAQRDALTKQAQTEIDDAHREARRPAAGACRKRGPGECCRDRARQTCPRARRQAGPTRGGGEEGCCGRSRARTALERTAARGVHQGPVKHGRVSQAAWLSRARATGHRAPLGADRQRQQELAQGRQRGPTAPSQSHRALYRRSRSLQGEHGARSARSRAFAPRLSAFRVRGGRRSALGREVPARSAQAVVRRRRSVERAEPRPGHRPRPPCQREWQAERARHRRRLSGENLPDSRSGCRRSRAAPARLSSTHCSAPRRRPRRRALGLGTKGVHLQPKKHARAPMPAHSTRSLQRPWRLLTRCAFQPRKRHTSTRSPAC